MKRVATTSLACSVAFCVVSGFIVLAVPLHAEQPSPAPSAAAFDAVPFGVAIQGDEGKWQGVRWAEPPQGSTVGRGVRGGRPSRSRHGQAAILASSLGRQTGSGTGRAGGRRRRLGRDGRLDQRRVGRRGSTNIAPRGTPGRSLLPQPAARKSRGTKVTAFRIAKHFRSACWPRSRCRRSSGLSAYTDAELKALKLRIQFDAPANPSVKLSGEETGQIEVFNGRAVAVRPLPDSPARTAPGRQVDDSGRRQRWDRGRSADRGRSHGFTIRSGRRDRAIQSAAVLVCGRRSRPR